MKKIFAFFKPSKWPIVCISGRVGPWLHDVTEVTSLTSDMADTDSNAFEPKFECWGFGGGRKWWRKQFRFCSVSIEPVDDNPDTDMTVAVEKSSEYKTWQYFLVGGRQPVTAVSTWGYFTRYLGIKYKYYTIIPSIGMNYFYIYF